MGSTKAFLIGLCALRVVVGCGPKLTEEVTDVVEPSATYLTDGRSDNGIAFTGFSPGGDLGRLKNHVFEGAKPNADQSRFSQSVLSVRKSWVFRSGTRALAVDVEFRDGHRVRFLGSLSAGGAAKKASALAGTLLAQGSGAPRSVRVQVSCEDPQCNVLVGTFLGSEELREGRNDIRDTRSIGGFILREEDRLAEESWEGERPSGRATGAANTLQVHVSSMEVLGGPSRISVSAPSSAAGAPIEPMEVPLLETDGECVDFGDGSRSQSSTCLMGNSQEGEVLIRATVNGGDSSHHEKRKFIRVLPRGARRPTPSSQVGESKSRSQKETPVPHALSVQVPCGQGVLEDGAHPWVAEAVAACDRAEVRAGARYWSKTGEKLYLEKFLQLRNGSGPNGSFEHAFSLMLIELRRSRLPEIAALIAYNESRFQPHRRSSAHAVGWWQLVPATARENGLKLWPKDERTDIALSTQAAARYLDSISQIAAWRGNFAMTLAAYNMGHNGLARSVQETEKSQGRRMSLKEISRFSTDFWTLSRLRVLPRETRSYVPRIFSAVSISLNPGQYGLNGPAFPTR